MMNPQDPILIALLPKPIDLERAHAGWYRVPLRHAPASLMEAKALAFYQPAAFGKARWQVAWWGAIRTLETLRRRELIPEQPNHKRANEWYVCVRLAPLVAIQPPKQAKKGRRLLFVPATWGAFQAAKTLDDLFKRRPRPIADNPLYHLILEQIRDKGGIPDPDTTRQRRIFESEIVYETLDW